MQPRMALMVIKTLVGDMIKMDDRGMLMGARLNTANSEVRAESITTGRGVGALSRIDLLGNDVK